MFICLLIPTADAIVGIYMVRITNQCRSVSIRKMSGSEVFLSFNRNQDISESTTNEVEIGTEEDDRESDEETKILCVVWKNGKLGASYYHLEEKLLFVYEEIVDLSPQFLVTRSLHREVAPKYVVTFGTTNDDYVKIIVDIMNPMEDASTTTDSSKTLPQNLFVLRNAECNYEVCKDVLYNLTIASNTLDDSELKRELFIQSLINFDYKMSVLACGGLVKFIEKNWVSFSPNRDDLQYLHVHQVSMNGHLMMDVTSLNALQVFQQVMHDSNFKRGMASSNREGLSIYKLFYGGCKSRLGQIRLKNMLLDPLNDMNEINKRLDFISFVSHLKHRDLVESFEDNIKKLANVHNILVKVHNFRASSKEWNTLYRTICHTVFMAELSGPFLAESAILTEFHQSVTQDLITLEASISNAIDFTNTTGRPVIRMGLDPDLDAKKLRRRDISKHVTAAAKVAVEQLPDFLQECAIVYLPEMGHLMAIKEWAPDCNPEDLQSEGFQFMFTLRGTIHYKNPICRELDECLGDINAEIIAHENRILGRLSGFVLKYNPDIRNPLRILALIDALIAMAKIASNYDYVRPDLNNNNFHEIIQCRHPLVELVGQFEPNDFHSGSNYSHMKVVTGPNGSGKSIYLKQIALVIFLAHVGSFVPAKSANIGMMYSLHTRMQTIESASVRLSAFMIDISQIVFICDISKDKRLGYDLTSRLIRLFLQHCRIQDGRRVYKFRPKQRFRMCSTGREQNDSRKTTQALHNARSNSLVLLDEFGRGTTGDEGFALLAGVLRTFHKRGEFCPHVLVSTHYQNISKHLPESPLVEYLQMQHTQKDGQFVYLYKLKQGVSNSYAFDVAASVGLDEDIIDRAKYIFERLRMNAPIEPLAGNRRSRVDADDQNELYPEEGSIVYEDEQDE